MDKVIRSVCQACHCECGVLVHVTNGRVTKIKGDPHNPMNRGFVCVKGKAQHQFVHHPDRVLYPMRRVGKRGSGRWERVTWDIALDSIAEKLSGIIEKYGSHSFATIKGTAPKPTRLSTLVLAYALGSPNVISVDNHICFLPSILAEKWTYGTSIMMDLGPDYLNSECILVIGGNPLASHPPRGIEILEAKQKRNAKLIVIDPYRTKLASRADIWLQIRPGTDDSLAMGLIKTIIDEGLYDNRFVKNWCYGFDQLRKHVEEYDIGKIAEQTWLSVKKIKEVARIYATTKPAALHHRVAVEHNINSVQTCRALAILIAITGNIDVPGGNLVSMKTPGYTTPTFRLDREIAKNRMGADEYPMVSGPKAYRPVVLSPVMYDTFKSDKPYPIKAIYCAGGNPVVNMQHSKDIWKFLKEKTELNIVADFFMSPTAEIADYVLPAATWLERDELCNRRYINYIAARQKVIEPLGESWHDMKIVIELVKRIPWADRKHVPWNDVEEFNASYFSDTILNFKKLKEMSCLIEPMQYKKYEKDNFDTPTGKVELYSTAFEEYGHSPLPICKEPPESPTSTPEDFDEYPLILYTGGRHIEYFHSEGRQIPKLRNRVPDPLVELNPETANKMNINDEDWVWLETTQIKKERVKLKAKLTNRVHPKMAHARHGWWFPEKPAPEHGCFDSNVNVILSFDPPRGEECASVRTRGTLCKVYKADDI